MRRSSVVILMACLAAAPPAELFGQGLVMGCGPVEGGWSWPIGGVVALGPDGSAAWSPVADGPEGFTGQWGCDSSTGEVVITWQQGLTDRLRLSADGDLLEGASNAGVQIMARRHDPAAALAAEPPGPVPPALVGHWLLEIELPSPAGPVPVLWTVNADGSYVIDAGPFSHAGRMTAFTGVYAIEAETAVYRDEGRYEIVNFATLITQAPAGVGRWHRRAPALVLVTADVDGQPLPKDLPTLAERVPRVVQAWRPDAQLVEIDFQRRDSNQRGGRDEIRMRYASPASGAGLAVTVASDGARFFAHDVANWGSGPVPPAFLDLPVAWAIARQHGLQPPLARADLRVWQPGPEPVLAWGLSAARGARTAISIDGTQGLLLEGDLSGVIAAYNAQWEAAVQGLRRFLAQPARPPSFDFGGVDGGSHDWGSSSYSGGSGGSTGGGYGTAAQNSWGAGDMRAYDRIMSGTPTGDDCYRYGC